ncbi:unnamed protein product, partial [marine sediment metagenome]
SEVIGRGFGDYVRTYPHRHGADGSFAARMMHFGDRCERQ